MNNPETCSIKHKKKNSTLFEPLLDQEVTVHVHVLHISSQLSEEGSHV